MVLILALLIAGCTKTEDPANKINEEVKTCGGIAGIKCPDGYICNYGNKTDIADAAGECVPK